MVGFCAGSWSEATGLPPRRVCRGRDRRERVVVLPLIVGQGPEFKERSYRLAKHVAANDFPENVGH